MKLRKKWMVLAAVVLASAVFAGLYWRHTQTPEYKARQLIAELRSLDKEPGTVKQWLDDLGVMKEKEPRDSSDIRRNLIALGEVAVPVLIEALKDKDAYLRHCAVLVLGKIGPAAKEAVPALIEVLKGKDAYLRHHVALALGEIGPTTKEVVPALIEALKDKDADVRSNAAWALGEIGPSAKEAVPALIEVLKDKDVDVRPSAADALGKIGPAAKAAVPALTEALKDEDKDVRQAAVEALKRISKEAEQKTLHHSGDEDSVSPSELIAN